MDQFLQLPSQSQGTSQSNSSQLIIKELALGQQENQRLQANLKELKEQISCLITSLMNVKFLKRSQKMEFIDKVQIYDWKDLNKVKQIRGNNRKPIPKKSSKQRLYGCGTLGTNPQQD